MGERILQLMHKRPSHIVLPAIHVKKEEIGELFVREMGTEPGNNDQTYLTHAARKNLRRKFIEAEAACSLRYRTAYYDLYISLSETS